MDGPPRAPSSSPCRPYRSLKPMDTQSFNATTALSGLTHRLSELGFDQLPIAAAGYYFGPFGGNPVALAGTLLELDETVRPWVTTFLDRNGPALQAWAATQNPADVERWVKGLDLSGLDDAFSGILGGLDLGQVGDWVEGLDLGGLNLPDLSADWLTGVLRFGRSAATPRDRLVIIDGAVGDLNTLLGGIDRATTDVLILDPTQDGIAQISTALNGRSDLKAIDVISHGASGALQLGSSTLDLAALGDRAAELATWATAIAPGADLHIYGCNVAAGATGEAFLQQLHQQLGADIAASDDLSGYGGDWDFERFIGQIETDVAVSRNLLAAYRDTLATITVNSTADAIATDGATTLREAIIAINAGSNQNGVVATGAYGTSDTIVFDPTVFSTAQTITLMGPGTEIVTAANDTVGDLDLLRNVTITGPGAHLLTIRSDASSRVFHINGNRTVTLSGITLTGGSATYTGQGAGIFIDDSGSTVNLQSIAIEGSQSTAAGSAISMPGTSGSGSLNIRQSTIANNVGTGSNTETIRINAGSLVVENSTISGNSSGTRGTVRFQNLNGVAVRHSTFYGLGSGIALMSDGTAGTGNLTGNYTVSNSIIKNFNAAPATGFGTVSTGITPTASGNLIDLSNATLDATRFSTTLALNGGTTKTHALLPAAGNPAVNVVTSTLTVDQRGATRPVGATADIGAFEVNAAPTITEPLILLPTMVENNPALGAPALFDRPRSLTFNNGGADDKTIATLSSTFSISSPDFPNIPQMSVGLGSTNGVISIPTPGAATLAGNGTNAVTLTGSLTAINAALVGMVFTPTAYFAGDAEIVVTASDGFNAPVQTLPGDNIVEIEREATAPVLTASSNAIAGAINTDLNVGGLITAAALRDTDSETVGVWRAAMSGNPFVYTPGRILIRNVPAGVTVIGATAAFGPDYGTAAATPLDLSDPDPDAFGDAPVYEIAIADLPNLKFRSTTPVAPFDIQFTLWSKENAAGATEPLAALEQTVTVEITGTANLAPVLTGNATFPTVTQGTTPTGQLISTLFPFGAGNLVTDAGPDATPSLTGIAVVGNGADPATEGVWEYSTDGTTWTAIPAAPTPAAAVMLSAASQVRFVPVAAYTGAATDTPLTVRAVDNTYAGGFSTNGAPVTQDVSVNGDPTAFSAATGLLQVTVAPAGANTAPVFTGTTTTLAAIAAGTTNPPGNTVTALFGGIVTDPDAGAALTGVAIVGNSANAATQGTWQYSTDGTSWFDVGAVADNATALALPATSRLRFVPVAAFTGAAPALTARAIDNTFVGAFTTGATRQLTDATVNGGANAISGNTAALNTSVTAVVVPPPPPPPAPTPTPVPAPPSPGNLVVTIAGGGPLSDGTPTDTVLGAIAPGAVFETTLTLQNSTANTTTLGAIQLPAGFTLGNPLPSSLGAGQQVNIRLLFSGTVPGEYKGIIGIPTNGVTDGFFNFPVVIAIDPSVPTPTPTPPGDPGTPTPTPTPPGPGTPTPTPPGPGPSPSPVPSPGPAPTPTPDLGGEPPVPPVPPVPPGGPLPVSVLPAIDLLDFQQAIGAGEGSLANLLFDPNFYLAQAPQAAAEVAAGLAQDLFDHYVKFGQFAGLSPSGAFDEALYRQLNPDIVPLIGQGITSGFDHYVKSGQFENRYTPLLLFDLGYYLAANPDLRGTIAPTDVAAGLGHFLSTGQKSGRNPSALFDAAFYAQRHPEALAAVQAGQATALFDYFVRFGLKAGHVPMPTFDGAQYLLEAPEAQAAIAAGQVSGPFEHYLLQGIGQGRGQAALLFDADFYLANHPQVAEGIVQGDFLDAYDQFIRFGQFAGWQPNPTFEEQTYLRNNPDVKAQVDLGNFETGVEHYILIGRSEGRKGMA